MVPEYAAVFVNTESNSEKDFKNIGIYMFFDNEEDSKVDWEEIFCIKEKQVK